MTIFDFLFLAAFLFTVGSALWIVVAWCRGARDHANRLLRRLGWFVGAYLLAVVAVALATPQRVLRVGETRRFDDWCITVISADLADHIGEVMAGPDAFVITTLRVFSTARRRSQAAPHASVHAIDASQQRHEVDPAAQAAYEHLHGPQPPLGSRLGPSGEFITHQVFRVPKTTPYLDMATPHGSGPGALIIGDDTSLFHRPTVIRVPLRPASR